MAGSYAFIGHDFIGAFVKRRLGQVGWSFVDDVEHADVAFTYCMSSSLLEDAYFDDGGLVKRARTGTVLVDLSPSTPSFAREISAVATVNDLMFVEAPLAVIDPFGSLEFNAYFACEDPDNVEQARELIGAIAAAVEETGAVGSAQLAKASNTVRMVASIVGAVESEALVRSTREVSGVHVGSDDDDFSNGFPVELVLADIVAAMTTADDVDLILPQLEAAMHLFELIAVIGGSDMNPEALSLLYREEAASAAHGLDWTRAEGLYADHDHAHDHNHGFDSHGFDDDDYGYAGGFGGYSAN